MARKRGEYYIQEKSNVTDQVGRDEDSIKKGEEGEVEVDT